MKPKIIQKAYQIDLSKIDEGYLFTPIILYSKNRNTARSELMKKIKYLDLRLLHSKSEISYSNIPVIRCYEDDEVEYCGKGMTREKMEWERKIEKHNQKLDAILNDNNISHCFIRKNGAYYRDSCQGYTEKREYAGIYLKHDAVQEARNITEIIVVPIDISEGLI
jgi:hypothetical protein